MTRLSTHVLDLESGRAAVGVEVTVEAMVGGEWHPVSEAVTDRQGRIEDLATDLATGTYRVVFSTGEYGNPLYPGVHIVVELDEFEEHYHLPLLLSPHGYTTYRGS